MEINLWQKKRKKKREKSKKSPETSNSSFLPERTGTELRTQWAVRKQTLPHHPVAGSPWVDEMATDVVQRPAAQLEAAVLRGVPVKSYEQKGTARSSATMYPDSGGYLWHTAVGPAEALA